MFVPVNPPPSPPVAPKKPGLSGWAWTGIGCGVMLLLGIGAIAAIVFFGVKKYDEFRSNQELALAELIISTNPDLKKVSSNPERGEITVRSKSGEEYTVNYKEITEGRFSFKDSNGNLTHLGGTDNFSELPSWVPISPSISGKPQVYQTKVLNKISGVYSANSTESIELLDSFFEEHLKKSGLANSSKSQTNLGSSRTRNRSGSDASKNVSVSLTQEGDAPVQVQVIYSEK